MAGALSHLHGNPTVLFSCRSDLRRFPLRSKLSTAATQIITQAHSSSSWTSLQADIEAHVKQAIPLKEPLVVYEPMRQLVFTAPQTTVPALCLAACELVGGHQNQALPAASALLVMQASAFTHEHLPLTDRPKPKPKPIGHVHEPNIELLIGDGMVPFALELLARSDDPTRGDSERLLRVMVEISRAVGSEGLVEGQYRKFVRTQFGGKAIKREVEKGEGVMHACGAACGAVLGGGSEEEIEKIRKYGFYVGMMQGLLRAVEKAEKGWKKELEEIRNLAREELEFFEGRNIELISSFIDV